MYFLLLPILFVPPLLLFSPDSEVGGGKRIRTADPLLAGQVLYQLSYTPIPLLLTFPLTTNLHPQSLPLGAIY